MKAASHVAPHVTLTSEAEFSPPDETARHNALADELGAMDKQLEPIRERLREMYIGLETMAQGMKKAGADKETISTMKWEAETLHRAWWRVCDVEEAILGIFYNITEEDDDEDAAVGEACEEEEDNGSEPWGEEDEGCAAFGEELIL